MESQADPPPEGRLIEEARENRRLSQNRAAELAGISGTRWRQIVSGVASGGRGIQVPVHGRAETVARMAQVVGLSAAQLEAVGRDDAARELRALPPADAEREPTLRELAEQMAALRREIEAMRAERDRRHDAETEQRLPDQRSG